MWRKGNPPTLLVGVQIGTATMESSMEGLSETKDRNFQKLKIELPYDPAQRRQWHPTPVLLPGKSHGQRSLVGCSPWGHKESDATEQLHFHFHALEKEMATHPSVLAWRIPGTGDPGGLPSMGSYRIRHD